MKAAVLVDDPPGLRIEDVDPRSPEEGEVRVALTLAAICGSDLKCVAGTPPSLRVGVAPGYPGHEGIGAVVESRSPDLPVGTRVLTCPIRPHMHGFAESQTLPAEFCVPLEHRKAPEEHLLMAQQLGTVLHAYRASRVQVDGTTLVIVGQGPAGIHFARLARHFGAATIVVGDVVPGRVAEAGSADVAVATDANLVRLHEAVMDATDERGADIVVDAAGGPILEHLPRLVREDGDIVLYGLPDRSDPVAFDHLGFFRRRARITAVSGAQRDPANRAFRDALDLIEQGVVRVDDLVTHRVPLQDLGRGFTLAHDERDTSRKVVVRM